MAFSGSRVKCQVPKPVTPPLGRSRDNQEHRSVDKGRDRQMNWQQLEKKIQAEIQPGHQGILKCRGDARRKIISNRNGKIAIKTGVKTDATKSVTFEMIKFAYEKILSDETFDSSYFQTKYSKEYSNGQCRYSIVGGILVELGEAERIPFGANSCYYRKKS
jgi:hypothetical protein